MSVATISPAIYRPSAWGQEFHNLRQNHALGAGAAGPGKTVVLTWEPLAQILVEHDRATNPRHPHRIGKGESVGWALHLRRAMPHLKQTIENTHRWFPKLDPGAEYNAQDHTWTFTSGYKYQFGHCKDPNSWMDYFSSQYTIVMFDELVQFLENQYDQIAARVRTSDPVLIDMLKVRAMTNPVMDREGMDGISVENPMWVRDRFVHPYPEGRKELVKTVTMGDGTTEEITRIYLPAKLKDNPNPVFRRRYEISLRDLKPHHQKALIDGNWYAQFGAFYGDEWDPQLHVCKPFKIPAGWLRWRSMDWGFKSPGVIHWWAMDEDGNVFGEYEMVFKGLTAKEVALRVRDREKKEGLWYSGASRITGPADTQLWEARGSSAMSMAQEFLMAGVPWTKADKTSRARNAGLLLGRLRDHQKKASPPGVVFFEGCKKTIETLPGILAEPGDPESPADGGWDHAHDSVLYSMAFASKGRAGIPPMRSNKRLDYEEMESGAGYGD